MATALFAKLGMLAALGAAPAPLLLPRVAPLAPRPAAEIVAVDMTACPTRWRPTLASLQGLAAKRGADHQLYLDLPRSGQDIWLRELESRRGVRVVRASDPVAVFRRFAPLAAGYIAANVADARALNGAFVLAAREEAAVVDSSHEALARAAGLRAIGPPAPGGPAAPDCWIDPSGMSDWELRDYEIMAGEPSGPPPADAPLFGWHGPEEDERRFISRTSSAGRFVIASDHALNLSVLSGYRLAAPLHQGAREPAAVFPRQTHLVSFVLTDGDNLGWVLGKFATDARWFGSPWRGRVPMGYGLPPLLAELAPDALDWYYRQAAADGGDDDFVAGPSGLGYFFPSRYPRAALRRDAARLGLAMASAGLHEAEILDEGALGRADLWSEYLRQPQIDGLIYLEYSRYDAGRGRIVWAAGKPVVAVRAMLWKGLRGADAESLLRRLAQARRDLDSPEGYSLVAVHAWSHTPADVAAVVRRLPPEIRAVTPDVFFATLRSHLPAPPPP